MINASDLETPERELGIETREGPAEKRARKRMESGAAEAKALREELDALRGRIAAARKLTPKVLHRVHNCQTCFRQARDETIRAIEEP
jgi:hypothetical protein